MKAMQYKCTCSIFFCVLIQKDFIILILACVQLLLTPPPAGEKWGESVCDLPFLIVFQGQHGRLHFRLAVRIGLKFTYRATLNAIQISVLITMYILNMWQSSRIDYQSDSYVISQKWYVLYLPLFVLFLLMTSSKNWCLVNWLSGLQTIWTVMPCIYLL
jgi:hypothetical protein